MGRLCSSNIAQPLEYVLDSAVRVGFQLIKHLIHRFANKNVDEVSGYLSGLDYSIPIYYLSNVSS